MKTQIFKAILTFQFLLLLLSIIGSAFAQES